ncbi:hypothetical protein EVG20_g6051, partial [Dentipellis fragilis]
MIEPPSALFLFLYGASISPKLLSIETNPLKTERTSRYSPVLQCVLVGTGDSIDQIYQIFRLGCVTLKASRGLCAEARALRDARYAISPRYVSILILPVKFRNISDGTSFRLQLLELTMHRENPLPDCRVIALRPHEHPLLNIMLTAYDVWEYTYAVRCSQLAAAVLVIYDHALQFDSEVRQNQFAQSSLRPMRAAGRALLETTLVLRKMLVSMESLLHHRIYARKRDSSAFLRVLYHNAFIEREALSFVLRSCFIFFKWQNIGSIIQVLTIHIILELRLYVMYKGVRAVEVLLLILPIAETIIFSVIFSMPPKIVEPQNPAPPMVICIHGDIPGRPWGVIYYVVVLATESILLVLSLCKAWRYRKDDLLGGMFELIPRDSAYYFALIFWVYIANLIIWIYNIPTINEVGTGFASALSSILADRLAISIRSAHYRRKPTARILDISPPTIASFAASVGVMSRLSFGNNRHDEVSMPPEIMEEVRELGTGVPAGTGEGEEHELQTFAPFQARDVRVLHRYPPPLAIGAPKFTSSGSRPPRSRRHLLHNLAAPAQTREARVPCSLLSLQSRALRMTQIDDIPLELLLWVFWWYTVTSADAPLTISSVCHTWRTLAQRTPELWTRLDLRFVREPNAQRADHSEERAMKKTRAWLKHSMASPLDVCVTIAHAHEPQVPGFTFLPLLALAPPTTKSTLQDSPLALLLSAHVPRIGSLAVHAPAEADAREFMISLFATSTSSDAALRSLQLSVTGDSAPAPANTQVEARTTQISPQVSDVYLSNVAIPSSWLTVAALTTLNLTRRLSAPPLATAHILDLLELSANLQSFELHARIRERPTDASLQPARHLTLPHLHTLALTANNLTDLLLPLRVPALTDLVLSDLDGYAPWTGRGLRAFLTTRPPLRELRLE